MHKHTKATQWQMAKTDKGKLRNANKKQIQKTVLKLTGHEKYKLMKQHFIRSTLTNILRSCNIKCGPRQKR